MLSQSTVVLVYEVIITMMVSIAVTLVATEIFNSSNNSTDDGNENMTMIPMKN